MDTVIDYEKRIRRLQQAINAAGLDSYVAVKSGSISYLFGVFAPWRTAVIVPKQGSPVAVVWNKDAARLIQETWMEDVVTWTDKTGGFAETVCRVMADRGFEKKRVGLEISIEADRIAPGILYGFELDGFRSILKGSEIVDATHILDYQMVLKDPAEIAILRQVAAMADAGVYAALQHLRPGITETELIGFAEYEMRRLGSEWFWSVTGGNEVGSGYRTWYEQGITQPATGKIIQYGEMVIIDVHPMYRLYFADFALNAVAGEPSAAQRKLANVWEKAVALLVSNMKPGATLDEVARQVSGYLKKTEYAERYSKNFGHGIGTCSRIPHVIREGDGTILEENMVLNGSVHVYDVGVGGMRLEIPILVTPSGGEPLCKIPLELHVRNSERRIW